MSEPAAPFRFGVVILAAGASTRMGTPKQLLEVEGRPLLVRAVEAALASAAWPVVVVLIAENPAWAEGMAASIRTGITTLSQFSRALDGALIALCDQPAFSADTIAQLVAAQRATGRTIAAARFNRRHAAPALFLREHFVTLATLTGEEGARALLNAEPSRIAPVDLPALALDLDTPADVSALKAASTPL
jgi:molybdenum cofactor cytidylyltransferase